MKIAKDVIRQKQLEAQMLYFMGQSQDSIGKKVGVHEGTITRWKQALGWEQARKHIDEQVSKKIQETVTEMKERHVKISRGIVAKALHQLQEDKMKLSAGDIIQALKHEKEMIQPTEYKSYNLIKNETNIQNNTQVTVNESIHDLIEKARNKKWITQDNSPMETLNLLNEQN